VYYRAVNYLLSLVGLLLAVVLSAQQPRMHNERLPENWDNDYSFVVMDRDYFVAAFGNLRNEVPHGKWLFFDTLGNVCLAGRYKNGFRQGEWIRYDYLGDRVARGLYKKGKLHGKWEYYDQIWFFKEGVRYEY
jgi:hypothetical protein